MRVDEISPIGPNPSPENNPEVKVTAPKPASESSFPVDTYESHNGQVSINGITAYFRIQDGTKLVYALVDDATGRVMRQVAAGDSLPLSVAIEQMLGNQPKEEA